MTAKVEFYQGEDDAFYWRLKAGNGEIVASGEGHGSERDARRAFLDMRDAANEAYEVLKR